MHNDLPSPPRPATGWPRVASIDIETYGKNVKDRKGLLPDQTVFHPIRSVITDGCSIDRLITSVSITLPTEDPRWPTTLNTPRDTPSGSFAEISSLTSTDASSSSSLSGSSRSLSLESTSHGSPRPWNASLISRLRPGPTFILYPDIYPDHLRCLERWLTHLDTLIGANLPFDIQYLRIRWPSLQLYLSPTKHTLIDSVVTDFLQNELRESRSIKSTGAELGIFEYASDEKLKKYPTAQHPNHRYYNGSDTVNTLVLVAELSTLILEEYGPNPCPETTPSSVSSAASSSSSLSSSSVPTTSLPSSNGSTPSWREIHPPDHWISHAVSAAHARFANWRLSPESIQGYSDTLWTTISMAESGIPISLRRLKSLFTHVSARVASLEARLTAAGLQVSGPGSERSKDSFLNTLVALPEITCLPRDRKTGQAVGIVVTDKKHKISFNEENRRFFQSHIPRDHPAHSTLTLISRYQFLQKLLSSYLYPLLLHQRKDPTNRRSIVLPITEIQRCLEQRSSSTGVRGATNFSTQTPTSSVPGTAVPSAETASSSGSSRTSESNTSTTGGRRNTTPSSTLPIRTPPTRSIIPSSDGIGLALPTWFVVPSSSKDDAGSTGGTQQGRVTCKNPSAQTFPDTIQRTIQSRFGDDGCIVKFDLSQIELRVAALLSNDPAMIRAYANGEDLHGNRAVAVLGESHLAEKYGPNFRSHPVFKKHRQGERQTFKTVNFGDLFLASAPTMHATVLEMTGNNLPLAIFETAVTRRPLDRPGLWAWQCSLFREARDRGFLQVPFSGITRHFLLFTTFEDPNLGTRSKDERKHEVVNFEVQTVAGLVMFSMQNRIRTLIPPTVLPRCPVHQFLNVYDAAFFDTRRSYVPTLRQIITDTLAWEQLHGYWGRLQNLLGRSLPIDLEIGEVT